MPTIGIIGFKTDSHVQLLKTEIEQRGQTALIIDFFNYPRFNLLSLDQAASYDDIHVDAPIRLSSIDVLFIRNFGYSYPSGKGGRMGLIEESTALRDNLTFQYSAVRMMANRVPVINRLDSSLYHRLKSYQFFLLHRQGVSVPQTLSTNDIEEIEAFLRRCPRGAVVKPATSGAEVVMADREFLARNRDILKARPFLFQQYVKGTSLRAYTLGGEIVSIAEIKHDQSAVDWREKETGIEPWTAEEALKQEIARAVRILGLAFCSVDIEYDAYTGKYYLLDFSPAPLYSGWSSVTNTDITAMVVEYLLRVIDHGDTIWMEHRR